MQSSKCYTGQHEKAAGDNHTDDREETFAGFVTDKKGNKLRKKYIFGMHGVFDRIWGVHACGSVVWGAFRRQLGLT